MTGVFFYLLTNPETLRKLTQEIRGAYKNAQHIDVASTLRLPYLQAVLKETQRIFPSSPVGLPRVSPGAKVNGVYVPPGVDTTRI
jgi:cytochrome P450